MYDHLQANINLISYLGQCEQIYLNAVQFTLLNEDFHLQPLIKMS